MEEYESMRAFLEETLSPAILESVPMNELVSYSAENGGLDEHILLSLYALLDEALWVIGKRGCWANSEALCSGCKRVHPFALSLVSLLL